MSLYYLNTVYGVLWIKLIYILYNIGTSWFQIIGINEYSLTYIAIIATSIVALILEHAIYVIYKKLPLITTRPITYVILRGVWIACFNIMLGISCYRIGNSIFINLYAIITSILILSIVHNEFILEHLYYNYIELEPAKTIKNIIIKTIQNISITIAFIYNIGLFHVMHEKLIAEWNALQNTGIFDQILGSIIVLIRTILQAILKLVKRIIEEYIRYLPSALEWITAAARPLIFVSAVGLILWIISYIFKKQLNVLKAKISIFASNMRNTILSYTIIMIICMPFLLIWKGIIEFIRSRLILFAITKTISMTSSAENAQAFRDAILSINTAFMPDKDFDFAKLVDDRITDICQAVADSKQEEGNKEIDKHLDDIKYTLFNLTKSEEQKAAIDPEVQEKLRKFKAYIEDQSPTGLSAHIEEHSNAAYNHCQDHYGKWYADTFFAKKSDKNIAVMKVLNKIFCKFYMFHDHTLSEAYVRHLLVQPILEELFDHIYTNNLKQAKQKASDFIQREFIDSKTYNVLQIIYMASKRVYEIYHEKLNAMKDTTSVSNTFHDMKLDFGDLSNEVFKDENNIFDGKSDEELLDTVKKMRDNLDGKSDDELLDTVKKMRTRIDGNSDEELLDTVKNIRDNLHKSDNELLDKVKKTRGNIIQRIKEKLVEKAIDIAATEKCYINVVDNDYSKDDEIVICSANITDNKESSLKIVSYQYKNDITRNNNLHASSILLTQLQRKILYSDDINIENTISATKEPMREFASRLSSMIFKGISMLHKIDAKIYTIFHEMYQYLQKQYQDYQIQDNIREIYNLSSLSNQEGYQENPHYNSHISYMLGLEDGSQNHTYICDNISIQVHMPNYNIVQINDKIQKDTLATKGGLLNREFSKYKYAHILLNPNANESTVDSTLTDYIMPAFDIKDRLLNELVVRKEIITQSPTYDQFRITLDKARNSQKNLKEKLESQTNNEDLLSQLKKQLPNFKYTKISGSVYSYAHQEQNQKTLKIVENTIKKLQVQMKNAKEYIDQNSQYIDVYIPDDKFKISKQKIKHVEDAINAIIAKLNVYKGLFDCTNTVEGTQISDGIPLKDVTHISIRTLCRKICGMINKDEDIGAGGENSSGSIKTIKPIEMSLVKDLEIVVIKDSSNIDLIINDLPTYFGLYISQITTWSRAFLVDDTFNNFDFYKNGTTWGQVKLREIAQEFYYHFVFAKNEQWTKYEWNSSSTQLNDKIINCLDTWRPESLIMTPNCMKYFQAQLDFALNILDDVNNSNMWKMWRTAFPSNAFAVKPGDKEWPNQFYFNKTLINTLKEYINYTRNALLPYAFKKPNKIFNIAFSAKLYDVETQMVNELIRFINDSNSFWDYADKYPKYNAWNRETFFWHTYHPVVLSCMIHNYIVRFLTGTFAKEPTDQNAWNALSKIQNTNENTNDFMAAIDKNPIFNTLQQYPDFAFDITKTSYRDHVQQYGVLGMLSMLGKGAIWTRNNADDSLDYDILDTYKDNRIIYTAPWLIEASSAKKVINDYTNQTQYNFVMPYIQDVVKYMATIQIEFETYDIHRKKNHLEVIMQLIDQNNQFNLINLVNLQHGGMAYRETRIMNDEWTNIDDVSQILYESIQSLKKCMKLMTNDNHDMNIDNDKTIKGVLSIEAYACFMQFIHHHENTVKIDDSKQLEQKAMSVFECIQSIQDTIHVLINQYNSEIYKKSDPDKQSINYNAEIRSANLNFQITKTIHLWQVYSYEEIMVKYSEKFNALLASIKINAKSNLNNDGIYEKAYRDICDTVTLYQNIHFECRASLLTQEGKPPVKANEIPTKYTNYINIINKLIHEAHDIYQQDKNNNFDKIGIKNSIDKFTHWYYDTTNTNSIIEDLNRIQLRQWLKAQYPDNNTKLKDIFFELVKGFDAVDYEKSILYITKAILSTNDPEHIETIMQNIPEYKHYQSLSIEYPKCIIEINDSYKKNIFKICDTILYKLYNINQYLSESKDKNSDKIDIDKSDDIMKNNSLLDLSTVTALYAAPLDPKIAQDNKTFIYPTKEKIATAKIVIDTLSAILHTNASQNPQDVLCSIQTHINALDALFTKNAESTDQKNEYFTDAHNNMMRRIEGIQHLLYYRDDDSNKIHTRTNKDLVIMHMKDQLRLHQECKKYGLSDNYKADKVEDIKDNILLQYGRYVKKLSPSSRIQYDEIYKQYYGGNEPTCPSNIRIVTSPITAKDEDQNTKTQHIPRFSILDLGCLGLHVESNVRKRRK